MFDESNKSRPTIWMNATGSNEYPEHRQSLVKKNKSEIKQDKKMSKTESRFKSKLESLKKLQHSASTNSAVEKARAFFRSLEHKHIGGGSSSNEHSSSSSSRRRIPTTTTTTNHHHHLDLSSSSSTKFPLPSSMSSSSSSSIIDDSHNTISLTTTNDSSFHTRTPSDGIATARLIRVINSNYSNPKDMIVHRVMHNEHDDHQLTASYLNCQQMIYEKNLPSSKQYYHGRSQNYSMSMEKHRDIQTNYDSHPLPPVSAVNPNMIYSTHIYSNSPPSVHSTKTNGTISNNPMSTSLYNYRPLVCRHIEPPSLMSLSFHERSDRTSDSIIQPLPASASSSSMSTWTQSVRRLNTEYTSTINALQQAKECLKDVHPNPKDNISQYANLVTRGIHNLSNNELKKPLGVTFCLTGPISPKSPLLPSSKNSLQQSKALPSNVFCRPKLVRPLDLDTFIPSLPKLESIASEIERNDKADSIAHIIKKFNNLHHSSSLKSQLNIDSNNDVLLSQLNNEQRETLPKIIIFDSIHEQKDRSNVSSLTSLTDLNPTFSNSSPRVHFEPSIATYEIEEIPYESPPPPQTSSSSSSSVSEDSTSSTTSTDENQIYENTQSDNIIQEETTYTVETFYKSTNSSTTSSKTTSSATNQEVVIIRESTTEEQFNCAREKQHQDQKKLNHHNPSQHTFTMNETDVPPLTTPLLTYLNLTVKQTAPMPPILEKPEKLLDNYHSVEPSAQVTSDFISDDYHEEDDETINDIITINPHTHSPSPPDHLSSSSSSSSTASSASTVLLSNHNITTTLPTTSSVTKKPPTYTNGTVTRNNTKSISQLPKRTTTTTTTTNASRLKQPTKIVSPSSKLKPPSSTITKPLKSSMIANSTSSATMTTSSIRKPAGITHQPLTMPNNAINKTTQQQLSLSTLTTGKKQNLVNGTNMTDSQNPADSSCSVGKNRVRSMVNQLNAAVSSTRPTMPSVISAKRTVTTYPSTAVTSRRPESTVNPTTSISKPTIIPPNRPSLQRAMTINNNVSLTQSPTSSTPATINNNIPSAYKRKTPLVRSTSNVKEGLLRWCQAQVAGYPNVSVTNLSSSWSDGLAFCALTHHFFPDAFDYHRLSSSNRKDNFELAFRIAEERAGVPQLLDVSDMLLMGNTPDYKCIFTYLNSFLAKVKDIHPTTTTTNGVEHH